MLWVRSQVFFYCWSWPTKALGTCDIWKTICSLFTVTAGIPPCLIAPPRLRRRTGVSISHRNRASASNSCSICLSARCCLLKVVGDRETITEHSTKPAPNRPHRVPKDGWLTKPPVCLFDACDKRSDPWPFSSRWVTGSALKDGASPHHAVFVTVTVQQRVTFKGCHKTLFGVCLSCVYHNPMMTEMMSNRSNLYMASTVLLQLCSF